MFDMTRAELGLTLFIFALIYSAGFLPRLGRWLGGLVASGESPQAPPSTPGTDELEHSDHADSADH